MSKIKSILLKIELSGRGIVNYDSGEQKNMYNEYLKNIYNGSQIRKENNISYAKKNFTKSPEGKIDYKLKISSQCLRNKMFDYIQSPNIMHHKELFLSLIASQESIVRGYTYAINNADGVSVKRSSALMLTDAVQTNDAKSNLEFFARGGEKIKKNQNDSNSDTSIFTKETVGDIEYSSIGAIDLMQLQFVSCSQIFDRMALDPDLFDVYAELLRKRLPNFSSSLNYYTIKNSVVELPERGFLFSDENIVELTKWTLRKMLNLKINRTNAFAQIKNIKIKFVENVLEDKLNSEIGWVDLTNEMIDSLTFEPEIFYELFDEEKAKQIISDIEEKRLSLDKKIVGRKVEKKAAKKNKFKNESEIEGEGEQISNETEN